MDNYRLRETLPTTEEKLRRKIKVLAQSIWQEKQINERLVDEWLNNFAEDNPSNTHQERINALYLLSNFLYFGNIEIRELLKSLYRDKFKYNLVKDIRKNNNDTTDLNFINEQYKQELEGTYFLSVGNPSESGSFILYLFRQENQLSKNRFPILTEIFEKSDKEISLVNQDIKRLVFLDDFSGSGSQAIRGSKNFVKIIKDINPKIKIVYLLLFATTYALQKLRDSGLFDSVDSVVIFDETFKVFEDASRYFKENHPEIDKEFCKQLCVRYREAMPSQDPYNEFNPMGYGECQLLVGFNHNTPNNTLPLMWFEDEKWSSIFKRYPKIYE